MSLISTPTSAIGLAATTTHIVNIPTGTISALIGHPPNTTNDFYIVAYLLISLGKQKSPLQGVLIPPLAPANYVYESRATSIIVGMAVSIFFMFSITFTRLLIRFLNHGVRLGLDDVFIIPGALLAITWPVLQILAVVYGGAGKHIWDVTYEEFGYFKLYTNLSKIFFFVAVGVVKISICLFNRRLTAKTSRKWLMFNNFFLFLLVVFILVSIFWNVFSCNPPWGGWDAIRLGKERIRPVCYPVAITGSILSSIHVVMDFGLLAVPIIVLWKVKMSWMTRARLYIVFAVGGGSIVGSILRQVAQSNLKSDIPWTFRTLEAWTLVDLTLGVIAASLPVLSAIIPARWKSVNASSAYKLPSGASSPAHYVRSKFSGAGGKEAMHGEDGSGFANSQENIVRTDVIELSFQSKEDLERGEGLDYGGGIVGRERGRGSGSWSRRGSGIGDFDFSGEKHPRSFSKNRSRTVSRDRGLDNRRSQWYREQGEYGHRVEIGREGR
ncbi:hypothetical protein DSL72_003841 [Monilinia vaccinii-corymbosi]|uniref:Rhodopsin domain-containing protein n=1 Tax=Monilinia vaccinii-corymbosi TaxID=61207 RepID=A0A8A3P9E0_9HELO|nr:hypothetical protein DSL72_003841 [Monilinia vaccinii-corymbosi]